MIGTSEEKIATGEMLSVRLDHSGPMELGLLTESLQALAQAHARYADAHGVTVNGDAVRLFVREIRSGSIIVDLIALSQNAPLFAEQIATIVNFTRNLVEILRYFKGDSTEQPQELKTRDAQDITKFLGPVAQDVRSHLNLTASDNAVINVHYTVSSNDANAIQNRAAGWIAKHAEPSRGVLHGQLFYFFQARDDRQATAGDRGIIEAISPNPVKTIFANETAKAATLDEALFRKAYVVDVEVQTIDGRPRLYKILEVTDSFDRD